MGQPRLEAHGARIPQDAGRPRVCPRVLALAAGVWHGYQLWEAGQIEFERPVISPHLPRSGTCAHAFPARRGYMFQGVSAASLASSSYSKERRCIPRH